MWGDSRSSTALLGKEAYGSHWLPRPLGFQVTVQRVTCGLWHTAAISTHGQLYTFGEGAFGALGHGDRRSGSQLYYLIRHECFECFQGFCGGFASHCEVVALYLLRGRGRKVSGHMQSADCDMCSFIILSPGLRPGFEGSSTSRDVLRFLEIGSRIALCLPCPLSKGSTSSQIPGTDF